VTSLIAPPRIGALLTVHGDDIEEDASDRIFSLFGQAIHKVLERAESTAIAEQRLYMQVPGPLGTWTVSGAMDRIEAQPLDDGSVVIQDYKTASVNEMIYGVKPEREMQLNVYKVLAELNGYRVSGLEAIFILRDWSKVKAATAANVPRFGDAPPAYPQEHVQRVALKMWEPEQAYAFIAERVAMHQQAREAYPYVTSDQAALPECSDEDRWAREPQFVAVKPGAARASKVEVSQEAIDAWITEHSKAADYVIEAKGDKFATIKSGAKRASKTFDTEAEASAWVAGQAETYEAQVRPGVSLRCLYYCSVAPICEQFKAIQAEGAAGVEE